MNATLTDKQVDLSAWFDGIVSAIRADQAELESGIANQEKKDLYKPLINGDNSKMFENIREESSKYFITQIVKSYLKEIHNRKISPKSLALQLSESKILVWAVIPDDDDENCEDQLFLTEAFVNSKFYKYGFNLSTTLVEESDSCSIPNHFTEVISG